MPRILLSHPHHDHPANTTITVDDETARELIRGGIGSPAKAADKPAPASPPAGPTPGK